MFPILVVIALLLPFNCTVRVSLAIKNSQSVEDDKKSSTLLERTCGAFKNASSHTKAIFLDDACYLGIRYSNVPYINVTK